MRNQKILALDFDGCLVDSVMEALFVSYVSYRQHINRKTRIFDNREPRITCFLDIISEYQSQVEKFRKYRHHIKDAADYAVILYIIENNLKVESTDQFFQVKELIPKENLQNYYDCFYEVRARIIKHNFNDWAHLTPGFPCIDKLRALINTCKTVIATANNKENIKGLLAKSYLNLNIREDDIVDMNVSTDKIVQMRHIADKYKIPCERIHFVDDNLSHLLSVKDLGVYVYLAGWGYCTEEQKDFARKSKDITLLTEDNVYSALTEALEDDTDK